MSEEEILEKKKVEKVKEEKVEEEPKKANNLITEANEAAVRIEDANKEMKENLDRQERMKVEDSLGGKTEAGIPSEKKKETDSEYAERVLAGNVNVKKD